jgi:ribosomal protein S18 acetylase RimI-like enzyme
MVIIRAANVGDVPFLVEMIREAAFHPARLPTLEEAARAPHAACWIDGWGRNGDLGVVAAEGDRSVGAAWCRLFTGDEPGMNSYVAGDVPGIAVATVPDRRGQGVGTALMRALLTAAREAGFSSVSLSVGSSNPAIRLYERLGFERVRDEPPSLPVLMRRATAR